MLLSKYLKHVVVVTNDKDPMFEKWCEAAASGHISAT